MFHRASRHGEIAKYFLLLRPRKKSVTAFVPVTLGIDMMKFAIIAAGEGSRLAEEGVLLPKPLVRLNGEAMVERLMRIFKANGAEEIVVIVNRLHPATEAFVRQLADSGRMGRVRIVAKTTPGSMYSFHELSPWLSDAPFCLTTVDTVFREDEFSAYVRRFMQGEEDGLMAVTDYVDDEKPLYVATDEQMNITGFHDSDVGDRFISGGVYCLRPHTLSTLDRCMHAGQVRMRDFQRGLVADGFRLKAYAFSKILDVDHAGDVVKAEAFLSEKR